MKNYIKTAHRANTMAPEIENTVEAFLSAVNNESVEAIEIDIQLTKDKKFVLMNYLDISSVLIGTDSRKSISDYTLEELQQMVLQSNPLIIKDIMDSKATDYTGFSIAMMKYIKEIQQKNSRISTLEEILSVDRKGKTLFIEIKDVKLDTKEKVREYVLRLMDVCLRYNSSDLIFISRNTEVLAAIKMYNPSFVCAPVLGFRDVDRLNKEFDGVSVAWDLLDKKVPNSDLLAHEYIKDNKMITAAWNLATFPEFKAANDIMGEYPYYSVGDKPEFMDTYEKNIRR